MNDHTEIKQQLVSHLKGGQAFSTIDTVLERIPYDKIGIVPDRLPYSFYQQFAHIRIAQLDILKYCMKDDYTAPEWPDDYWPKEPEPESRKAWDKLKSDYFSERDAFCDLIHRPETDLMNPFEANSDHNLLRQAGLIIEHTAYHTGQLYILYRLLTGDQ